MENVIIFIVLGIFAGVFAGMGMGGGTFLIPLLILFCSFSQLQAQSINLIAFIPMSLIALIIHMKNKLVCYKQSIGVIVFALAGCILGAVLLSVIELKFLRVLYAVFLVFVGIWLFYDAIKKKDEKN